jgi:uncharacterized membrane protein
MRKLLELVSLAAIVFLCWLTYGAVYGQSPITGPVPTHFDLAGHPNHWGSSHSLLILPAAAIGLYLLTTVISQFPGAFNYPVRITDDNRARLESLALDMIAWMKTEIILLFALLQSAILHSIRLGAPLTSPWPIFVALPATLITTVWFIAAMRRAA